MFNTSCFHPQIAISGFPELADLPFNGLWSVARLRMWSHECAILRELCRDLIVIARVERSDVILSQAANLRRHVQKRAGVRKRTRVRPIHLLPPGGRQQQPAWRRGAGLPRSSDILTQNDLWKPISGPTTTE